MQTAGKQEEERKFVRIGGGEVERRNGGEEWRKRKSGRVERARGKRAERLCELAGLGGSGGGGLGKERNRAKRGAAAGTTGDLSHTESAVRTTSGKRRCKQRQPKAGIALAPHSFPTSFLPSLFLVPSLPSSHTRTHTLHPSGLVSPGTWT